MKDPPRIIALGVVDARGVTGTRGVTGDWTSLGVESPGTPRTFRALFQAGDATFRRLDRPCRALVLAAEAAGLSSALPEDARDATAIVVETASGSLDTDLRFARSLQDGLVVGSLFPYTLASASLGEVALRHRLRGPAICLSIREGEEGEALREAGRLLEDGDARFALACCVESVSEARPGSSSGLRAMVALLAEAHEERSSVAPWPGACPQPFACLAGTLRR